jgi:Mce-associated membrane protein
MLSRIKRLPWRVIVPWLLFVLAVTAAVTLGLSWQESEKQREAISALESDREEVAAVARDFVTVLTNFSHETIEQDAEAIRSFAVGEFQEEADTFFGERAIDAIKKAEATSTGEIRSLFVQDLDSDEASVFGVVSETVTNAASDEPRTEILRLEVGLIETEDGWKVQRVDVFQSPGTGLVPGV